MTLYLYLSQGAKFFLSPLNQVLIFPLFFFFWGRKKSVFRVGRIVRIFLVVWYMLLFSPFFSILLFYFERSYPVPEAHQFQGRTAFVLSGGTGLFHHELRQIRWFSNPGRVIEPLRLFKQGYLQQMLFTGGQVFPLGSQWESEAHSIGNWWHEMGVPKENILIENEARNTYENFKNSIPLLNTDSILLVSSAFHLPRAMMVAKKFNLKDVLPYPVDFKVESLQSIDFYSFENVENAHRFIFEVIGMGVYLITGQGK